MKKRFLIGTFLCFLVICLIGLVILPLAVAIHEYSHLAACKIFGGDGITKFEGAMWLESYMEVTTPFPPERKGLFLAAGGLGVFIAFALIIIAMQASRRRKLLPDWTIIIECPLLFLAIISLCRAVEEFYLGINDITILLPPGGLMLIILYCAFGALGCELVYIREMFDLVYRKTKTAQ